MDPITREEEGPANAGPSSLGADRSCRDQDDKYIRRVSAEVSYPTVSRTLDNGLRVVSPTPGLGVVAVNIWYDVGSRHEQPHRQGFAHLFEHLMFQGSRHVKSDPRAPRTGGPASRHQ